MRITAFRQHMTDEFGTARADTLSKDHVFSALGGRTVDQALAAGQPVKIVWHAVCIEFDIPVERR